MEYPEYIDIGQTRYLIQVEFFKKKNSSVTIKDNVLVFRLSSKLSSHEAQQHFSELLEKMVKKIQKSPGLQNVKTIETVLEEGGFSFAGDYYAIQYYKRRGVKLKENTFYVGAETRPELIERHIVNLLIQRYTARMEKYLDVINRETFNFSFKGFELKPARSKWGHCSPGNTIMLNLKLLNAPREVLDYVIIHELAHISCKDHSPSFWGEVERFCPDHKRIRKILKKSPPRLFE